MTHMWETQGPTIDEQIEAAAAAVVVARMTDDEKKAAMPEGGFADVFGDNWTDVDTAREAVKQAQRDGQRYKYGAHAFAIFGLPE